MTDWKKYQAKEGIESVTSLYDADLVRWTGPLREPEDSQFADLCRERSRRRKNAILLLTTFGGSPDSAYRIARCLQEAYNVDSKDPDKKGTLTVFVSSSCKSAGTLLATGANKIIMSPGAELGPIDIQLRKPDEVGERTSGLTPLQALGTLQNESRSLFKQHFRQLRFDDDLVFSTKVSAEIATNLTIGLLKPLYEQIDPIRLAEVDRLVRISTEYGTRLAKGNLKDNALERLLVSYPSHGFIIDPKEAAELFENIDAPSPELQQLGEFFDLITEDYLYGTQPWFRYLSLEPPAPAPAPAPAPSTDAVDGAGDPE